MDIKRKLKLMKEIEQRNQQRRKEFKEKQLKEQLKKERNN